VLEQIVLCLQRKILSCCLRERGKMSKQAERLARRSGGSRRSDGMNLI